MRKILILCLALVAVAASAEIVSESLVTSDSGLSLTDVYNQTGPSAVDIATNGSATIKFIWFGADSRTTQAKSITHYLRSDFPPRHFSFAGGPDSAYVDVDTATEVIVSW